MDNRGEADSSLRKALGFAKKILQTEKPTRVEPLFTFPKEKKVLWIDRETKNAESKPFQPLFYFSTPTNIKGIPESLARDFIHFVPPEVYSSIIGDEDMGFRIDHENGNDRKSGSTIIRKYIPYFVELLQSIRKGNLKNVEFLVGRTDGFMAKTAMRLGFKRCWEEDKNTNQPAFSLFSNPDVLYDDRDYTVGISVSELSSIYNLDVKTPTAEDVLKRIIEIRQENRYA